MPVSTTESRAREKIATRRVRFDNTHALRSYAPIGPSDERL